MKERFKDISCVTMFFHRITVYKQLQDTLPDISCVKLISVTGPDSGRKMIDEKCPHGNDVTQITEEAQEETGRASVM